MCKYVHVGISRDRRPYQLTPMFGRLAIIGLTLVSNGCALQGVVEKQGVDYNTAAAGMSNQLALLNIVRAKEHLPIFYTSISRLSGSAVVTAGGGFNAAIKSSESFR